MILSAELRPFETPDETRDVALHATIDIEGRSYVLLTFRLVGFGDRLVFPPPEPALTEARALKQADFVRSTLLKTMGLEPGDDQLVPAKLGRTDGLWRSTCLEIFGLLPDGSYTEFNVAPSGHWAAYQFDGYRSGMTELDGSVEIVDVRRDGDDFELKAWVNWRGWPHVRAIGVSAVLETIDGGKAYWALAHPAEKPDFHHPDSFTLSVRPEPA
ncbi:MAG: DOMON-like domain-containing protein [Caulobacterales bacterium]|nr:DOMON-like domain-containing protein [Caulobacterales bacterium]